MSNIVVILNTNIEWGHFRWRAVLTMLIVSLIKYGMSKRGRIYLHARINGGRQWIVEGFYQQVEVKMQ